MAVEVPHHRRRLQAGARDVPAGAPPQQAGKQGEEHGEEPPERCQAESEAACGEPGTRRCDLHQRRRHRHRCRRPRLRRVRPRHGRNRHRPDAHRRHRRDGLLGRDGRLLRSDRARSQHRRRHLLQHHRWQHHRWQLRRGTRQLRPRPLRAPAEETSGQVRGRLYRLLAAAQPAVGLLLPAEPATIWPFAPATCASRRRASSASASFFH